MNELGRDSVCTLWGRMMTLVEIRVRDVARWFLSAGSAFLQSEV